MLLNYFGCKITIYISMLQVKIEKNGGKSVKFTLCHHYLTYINTKSGVYVVSELANFA